MGLGQLAARIAAIWQFPTKGKSSSLMRQPVFGSAASA